MAGLPELMRRTTERVTATVLPPPPEVQGGPAGERPFVGSCHELVRYRPDQIDVQVLFNSDRFAGALIGFEPDQRVPEHSHQHKDEVFDVVSGQGEILVQDTWQPALPGSTFYIPAGTVHALRNTGGQRWVVRETVRERIYARAAILVALASLRKRLGKRGD